jgi:hypothetical protein
MFYKTGCVRTRDFTVCLKVFPNISFYLKEGIYFRYLLQPAYSGAARRSRATCLKKIDTHMCTLFLQKQGQIPYKNDAFFFLINTRNRAWF